MANVFNKETGQILLSVNTPDYDPGFWLIDPKNIEELRCIPRHYRIFDNGIIREATDKEKIDIDASRADMIALQGAYDQCEVIEERLIQVYKGEITEEAVNTMISDLIGSWT